VARKRVKREGKFVMSRIRSWLGEIERDRRETEWRAMPLKDFYFGKLARDDIARFVD